VQELDDILGIVLATVKESPGARELRHRLTPAALHKNDSTSPRSDVQTTTFIRASLP
jgi:hypothetical protein